MYQVIWIPPRPDTVGVRLCWFAAVACATAIVVGNVQAGPPDDFTIEVLPPRALVCTPNDAVFDVSVTAPVSGGPAVILNARDVPSGAVVGFSVNPVFPPGTSMLTISNVLTPGWHSLTVDAQGSLDPSRYGFDFAGLHVAGTASGNATLSTPANGATGVSRTPTLSWNASNGARYTIDIATDPTFASLVISALIYEPFYSPSILAPLTVYYWRVHADNGCGSSPAAPEVFSFTTGSSAGGCPAGVVPVTAYASDFESHSGGNTAIPSLNPWEPEVIANSGSPVWGFSGARTHSGVVALHAEAPDAIRDERLVSPPLVLSSTNTQQRLSYWNYQSLESNNLGGCWDGAILEISSNGGGWTRLDAQLLTDPYDGPVAILGGVDGWCGDPQDWTQSIVDLDAWAGQTVRIGLRVATDGSIGREGWYVDDLWVGSCAPDSIFKDGFEEPFGMAN